MDTLIHASPFTGYVYPNETIIPWTVLIVVYPYLTGLVAGAFTISSLYQVFGFTQLRPVAHFALLVSLCCMLTVPIPLLLHLGHPERAFNAMITPHTTSAFAVFGYAAGFYIILLVLETWFVFRPHIVHQAQQQTGVLRWFYSILSLGSFDLSEKAMSYDRKWLFTLAIIGIPGAHGLHGYVGFVFGSLKSREWWSSDLMPVIFLLSAIISGTAFVIVLYVTSCKLRKVSIDLACMKIMAYALWGFMMFTLLIEGVEFLSLVYRGREGIDVILEFVTGPLIIPFFILQFGVGSVLPLLVITFLIWRGTSGTALIVGITGSAILVLLAVLMMRYNVVIGGQEISKTAKGLIAYHPPIFGREGLLAAGSSADYSADLAVGAGPLIYTLARRSPGGLSDDQARRCNSTIAGGEFVDRRPRRIFDAGIRVGRSARQQHDEADDLAVPPAIAAIIEPPGKGDGQCRRQAMTRDRLAQIGIAGRRRLLRFAGGEIDRGQRQRRRRSQRAVRRQESIRFRQVLAVTHGGHQHDDRSGGELRRRRRSRRIQRCGDDAALCQAARNMLGNAPRLSIVRRIIKRSFPAVIRRHRVPYSRPIEIRLT